MEVGGANESQAKRGETLMAEAGWGRHALQLGIEN